MSSQVWRKSSYSGTDSQTVCVEVANLPSGIGIRDSKNPDHSHLTLTPHAFATLIHKITEERR